MFYPNHDNFWQNKKIVITGSNGFIGSHLGKYFREKGTKVIGISKKISQKTDIQMDVLDKPALAKLFSQFKPDICYHLASKSAVEDGQKNPYQSFNVNIFGTMNILELCRLHKVPRVIIASTSHVYGDATPPSNETVLPRPSRPYETSKTCADMIAQSYAETYNLSVLIPRFTNTYGPGDLNFNRIIPKTIKAIISGDQPKIWGGNAKREYLYIDDVIYAYELLGSMSQSKIENNRIYNFGSRQAISARNLVMLILRLSGKKVIPIKIEPSRQDEILDQRLSWKKAKNILSWSPKYSLICGLKKTIDWYLCNC